VACVAAVACATEVAGAAIPDETASQFAVPTRLDQIGRILVPVTINGRGPFRFIVDTGASRSTVAPELVQKLNLEPAGDMQIDVSGITGTARVPAVPVSSLRCGDLTIESESFPVLWAPLMGGADGILGIAGLTNQSLSVDFEHNKVTLSAAASTRTPLGYTRIRTKRINGGLVAIPAHVGRVRVLAVIDTGSERTLGNLALRDAMNAGAHPGRPLTVATVYGATTDVVQGETQVAPPIAIEQLRITDVTLTYGDFHIFQVWQLRAEPALIIGMDILGTLGAITIDFQHQYLYLQGRGVLSTSSSDALHNYSILRSGGRH